MTDEDYEDYFILELPCPYHSGATKQIVDVVCEFMAETFGGPCHVPKVSVTMTGCKNDCKFRRQGYETCWKRTFEKMKEKKDHE